jgi:hypothetical protein
MDNFGILKAVWCIYKYLEDFVVIWYIGIFPIFKATTLCPGGIRPIASSVSGEDDTTRPRRQGKVFFYFIMLNQEKSGNPV